MVKEVLDKHGNVGHHDKTKKNVFFQQQYAQCFIASTSFLEHTTEIVREKPEEPTRYYQPSISLSRILADRRNQQGLNFQSG
jgi:hypothetical protein